MEILQDYDLSKLNTFSIQANAKFFVEIKNEQELKKLFTDPIFTGNKKFFLGGGSNVLFTRDFDGIVVLNALKGIEIVREDSESVTIRSMAGETWHDLVTFAVERGYWGIENLSFIPGTVGAAPMQNIGAYGAELENVLEDVEAAEIATGERKVFTKEECELGYRDSIFKNALKGKYCITAVTIKLSKVEKKNISYKVLKEYIEEHKIDIQTPKNVSDAVMAIRKSKLPDPNIIPNAGSFFKNIFLSKEEAKIFLAKYPEVPYFEDKARIKIPAAYLIEACGPASPQSGGASAASWRGYRVGNVGVHDKQALVLVHYGGAEGGEFMNLVREITTSVKEKFGIELVPEVNIV